VNQKTWELAKGLLGEALDQPTAEREAYVRARCTDPALLEEIQAYLREYEAHPHFLETQTVTGSVQRSGRLKPPRLDEEMSSFLSGQSSALADLGPEALSALLLATHPCEYAAGEQLMRQGDPGEYLLLILDGSATAQVRDAPTGRPPVGEFGPGDIVGEMSLITNAPRMADVVAQTRVRARLLTASEFHDLADSHPEVRVLLTNMVADRLGQATYDGLGGKDIEGYRIDRCIGRGGMGIVYEARRLATGETVALKMMNHRLLYAAGAIRRFKREAAMLQTLDHVSIPRLYECFAAYRTQFLAMEFCEGSTLQEIVSSRGPLDEPIVRRIVGQLAIALRYVHAQGVVHRDLKPSNVMLTRSGHVKLLDFGIVMSPPTQHDSTSTTDLTVSPRFVGTMRYMAPEQFSREPIDHRADLYGLACVAFEALSGRPAIKALNLLEVIQEKMSFVLPPADQIGPGVTPEMHQVLARGFEPRRDQRVVDLDALSAWAGPIDLDARE